MKSPFALRLLEGLSVAMMFGAPPVAPAQGQPPPDHPAVTVRGQTYTPRSILARNMGSPEDQSTAFPPHKIVGNIYYVGTRTLSSFLVVTPLGGILVNSLTRGAFAPRTPLLARSRGPDAPLRSPGSLATARSRCF